MKAAFSFWRDSGRPGVRWRFHGGPLGWILALSSVVATGGLVWYAADYACDAYAPYEGEVVAVRRPWLERFVLESSDDEHLVIRTPEGRTIVRTVPRQHLVLQGIGLGDYVVKKRGFGNRVRRRGPGTARE